MLVKLESNTVYVQSKTVLQKNREWILKHQMTGYQNVKYFFKQKAIGFNNVKFIIKINFCKKIEKIGIFKVQI